MTIGVGGGRQPAAGEIAERWGAVDQHRLVVGGQGRAACGAVWTCPPPVPAGQECWEGPRPAPTRPIRRSHRRPPPPWVATRRRPTGRASRARSPSTQELDACGSRSTTSTRLPAAIAAAANPSVTVVLPTPPFWLRIASVRATLGHRRGRFSTGRSASTASRRRRESPGRVPSNVNSLVRVGALL